jgi:CO/xanthine dehydrogenase Mo-binding subunit
MATDPATLTQEQREATLGGIGSARKRKEDARFIQGKGHYVDDLKLPGMLFGDFARSQYGHARIKSSRRARPRRSRAWSRCCWRTTLSP